MQQARDHPGLRLVGGQTAAASSSPSSLSTAARQVARENRQAARLSADDARWVLAVRVSESLEGGRAAILPPEKREKLQRLATHIGLRPFDTSLVIAIVQDSARSGLPSLGRSTAERLTLVSRPVRAAASDGRRIAWSVLCAMLLGVLLLLVMARWVIA